MNTVSKILSIPIALLFLVSPLLGVSKEASAAPPAPTDCVPSSQTAACQAYLDSVAGNLPDGDPLWLALYTSFSALPGAHDGPDSDGDGRADTVIVHTDDPLLGSTGFDAVFQADYFYGDGPAQLTGVVTGQPYDIAIDPTLMIADYCDDGNGLIGLDGCAIGGYTGGNDLRLSNHFERQESFLPGHSPAKHSPESFDIAIYSPKDAGGKHVDGTYDDGLCVLCINIPSLRIVFGESQRLYNMELGGNAPVHEAILDFDLSDPSIEALAQGQAIYIRNPRFTEGGPQFADGRKLMFGDLFINSDPTAQDSDDDGYPDQMELDSACFSNPTNPMSTCDDLDGDGRPNAEDNDPFVPAIDTDKDGLEDPVDNCPTVANADQANFNGPGQTTYTVDHVGDVCGDFDGDGVKDSAEIATESNPTGPNFMDKTKADTDGDGLSDGMEVAGPFKEDLHNTNVRNRFAATKTNVADSDGDGVTDCVETRSADCNGAAAGTGWLVFAADYDAGSNNANLYSDPNKVDSDADGVADPVDNCLETANTDQANLDVDLWTAATASTGADHRLAAHITKDTAGDACDNDKDGDGITNSDEATKWSTDPAKADTDGDSLSDNEELQDNSRCTSDYVAQIAPGSTADKCQQFAQPAQHGKAIPVVGGTTPEVPPVYPFLSPLLKDSCADGTPDSPADFKKSPCTPNVVLPNLGAAPAGDAYDYYDLNGDGNKGSGLDANGKPCSPASTDPLCKTGSTYTGNKGGDGQLDAVESGVFYYDQDPYSPTQADSHGRFAGASGLTFTIWDTPGPQPYAKNRAATFVRYGNVAATNTDEIFVLELASSVTTAKGTFTGPVTFRTMCIMREAGVPGLYFSDGPFDPTNADKPCGDRYGGWNDSSVVPGINSVLNLEDPFYVCCYANYQGPWIWFTDSNNDGVPESVQLMLLDPTNPCDPFGIVGECRPGPPIQLDLTSVQGVADTVFGLLGNSGTLPAIPPEGCVPANPTTCLPPSPLPHSPPGISPCATTTPGAVYVCWNPGGKGMLSKLIFGGGTIHIHVGPITLDT